MFEQMHKAKIKVFKGEIIEKTFLSRFKRFKALCYTNPRKVAKSYQYESLKPVLAHFF
jgi:hypothetical protein